MGIDGVPLINGMIGNYQITVDYSYKNDYDTDATFIGRIFHISKGQHKLIFRQNEADCLNAAIAAAEKLFKLPGINKDDEIKWMK